MKDLFQNSHMHYFVSSGRTSRTSGCQVQAKCKIFFPEFSVGVSHHVTMIYDKRKNHSQTQPCSKQGASERMGWKISTNGLMFHDKCFIMKASEWLDNPCFQRQGLNISAWLETKINTSLNYLVYRNIYMNKKVIETWFLLYSRCNK